MQIIYEYMHYLKIIFPCVLIVNLIITQSCNKEKGIIAEEKFATILSEMYLADQYIERTPQLRGQTDTLVVYEALFRKHGYTSDNYKKSVEYYLQKGDSYKKLHQQAREILALRDGELKKLLDIKNGTLPKWWAVDTIKTIKIENLREDTYLRALKWIILQNAPVAWQFKDSAIIDIPQNIKWWQHNIETLSGTCAADTGLILLKDYTLKQKQNSSNTAGVALQHFTEKKINSNIETGLDTSDTHTKRILQRRKTQDSLLQKQNLDTREVPQELKFK